MLWRYTMRNRIFSATTGELLMSLSAYLRRPVLILDLLAFVVCCAGIVHIYQKAGLGVDLKEISQNIYCDRVTDVAANLPLHAGDKLLAIQGQVLENVEDVEFLLDGMDVGQTVSCEIQRDASTRFVTVTLVPYYGTAYLIIVIVVSGLFFSVGLFVHLRRPEDRAATTYHFGSVGTAVMLSTTWGHFSPPPAIAGILLRIVFSAAYAFVPVFFFHFIRLFPRERGGHVGRVVQMGLYLVAGVFAFANGYSFLKAGQTGLVSDFHLYLELFTLTRFFLVALVLAGLIGIRHAYITAGDEPERRRLRWVVWGLFVGMVPFIGLWVIPSIILSYGLVPEEVMLFASGAIPVAFGISIVRYHIMDIDLLLGRSVVYTIVMGVLILLYAAIVGGVAAIVTTLTHETSAIISGAAAITMALAFEPLRGVVQHIVDRRFFRVRYNYRGVGRELLDQIKQAPSLHALAEHLVLRLNAVIPTEGMALLLAGSDRAGLTLLARSDPHAATAAALPGNAGDVWNGERVPLASEDQIEPGVTSGALQPQVRAQWGIVLAVPLLAKDARLMGLLVIGPKRSGTRFSSEDVDLLTTVCSSAGMEIERIRLLQELVLKQEEAGRLQVMNTLKSDFVSYVSHDLRTPLTSIKMYAELLLARLAPRDRKVRDYLAVIQGEADRLNRMVTTILDSARIEEGVIQYTMQDVDLKRTLRAVLRLMEYQFRKEGFTVKLNVPGGRAPLRIHADPDAVREAILNLLTNAMKYSQDDRTIVVAAGRKGKEIFCSVKDHGTGIRPEALPHLFDKFYRDPTLPGKIQGVGIGLSVVKHIMDVHGGRVAVTSTPGAGSEFTLVFPHHRTLQGGKKNEEDSRRRG
jgi:signal transduction histidine kinase